MPRPFNCSRCQGTDPNCPLCHEAAEDRIAYEADRPDPYKEWAEMQTISEFSTETNNPTTDRHG